MTAELFTVGAVVGLLVAEWRLSRANERALCARGAVEASGDVYRALAVIYPGCFVLMSVEGLRRAASASAVPVDPAAPSWYAAGLLLFVASKALKYWAIAHLGERWTFKVLVLPHTPLVTSGPYRYVAHPNYIAIFGELAGMALMMSALVTGPIAIAAFALVLRARLKVETRALRNMVDCGS